MGKRDVLSALLVTPFVPESVHQKHPGQGKADLIGDAVQRPVVIDPQGENRNHPQYGKNRSRRRHHRAEGMKYRGLSVSSGLFVVPEGQEQCRQRGKGDAAHQKKGSSLRERNPVVEPGGHRVSIHAGVVIKARLVPDRILSVRNGNGLISRPEHRILVGIENVDIGVPGHGVHIDGEGHKALLSGQCLLLLCQVLQGAVRLDMEEPQGNGPALVHLLHPGLQGVQMAVLRCEVVPGVVVGIDRIRGGKDGPLTCQRGGGGEQPQRVHRKQKQYPNQQDEKHCCTLFCDTLVHVFLTVPVCLPPGSAKSYTHVCVPDSTIP